MQARMEVYIDPATGRPTNSSVFTAFVMRDAETKIQIELTPTGVVDIRLDDELVAFIHETEDEEESEEHIIPTKSGSISSSRTDRTFAISFNLGYTFRITQIDDDSVGSGSSSSFGILAFASESRIGRAGGGLFGYYDRNPENDLRTPDGAAVAPDSPLSMIHYEFGLKWMVSAAVESLFL